MIADRLYEPFVDESKRSFSELLKFEIRTFSERSYSILIAARLPDW